MRIVFWGVASSGTPLIAPALMRPLRSAAWMATLMPVSVTPVSDAVFLAGAVVAEPLPVPEPVAAAAVVVDALVATAVVAARGGDKCQGDTGERQFPNGTFHEFPSCDARLNMTVAGDTH